MYKTILIISYSNYIFTDKLEKLLKGINYDIVKKNYEFKKNRSDIILFAYYEIETFNNIRNILIKKLEKEFEKYPIDVYKLLGNITKRETNKYYIISKIKDDKKYFFIRTEYSSRINPNILW
jgi:hypothetical protein